MSVRPFDSGTQYGAWVAHNCMDGCAKYDPENASPEKCEIDYALGLAMIGNGRVEQEMADRMGYSAAHAGGEFPWTWDCPEREQT